MLNYTRYLATLLFFLTAFGSQPVTGFASSTYFITKPDGKQLRLKARSVGDRDYFAFNKLVRSLFVGRALEEDGTVVATAEGKLQVLPATLYVSLHSATGIRMVQLPYPNLLLGREIYVPALPFFKALDKLSLFHVEAGHHNRIRLDDPSVFWQKSPVATYVPHDHNAAGPSGDIGPGPSATPASAGPHSPSRQALPADWNQSAGTGGVRVDPGRNGMPSNTGAGSAVESAPRSGPDRTANSYVLPPDLKRSVLDKPVPQKRAPRFNTPARADDAQPPGQARRRYIVPGDLKRREGEEIDSSHSHLHLPALKASPLLASLLPVEDLEAPATQQARVAANDAPSAVAAITNPEPKGPVITNVSVNADSNSATLLFEASSAIDAYQKPEQAGSRVVLRFPGADNAIDNFAAIAENEFIAAAASEKIRAILVYRIRFAREILSVSHKRRGSSKIELSIRFAGSNDVQRRLAEESAKWNLDVIVLDAGHGGKDPGAIGVTGIREKDIALKLALELGRLIKTNMPATKVVYTRDDDTFIELYRRGQIANEAGGKLFISIHCNSMPTIPHTAEGFETYILRPGRNEEAVRVAHKENGVVKFEENTARYKELNDEEFIVINMAQKAFVKLSEQFAMLVQEEVGKTTTLKNRGVNQAGFYVLVGASMPNILFEAAFLSNRKEEKYLASTKGQKAIAKGMYNAIERYAQQYRDLRAGN